MIGPPFIFVGRIGVCDDVSPKVCDTDMFAWSVYLLMACVVVWRQLEIRQVAAVCRQQYVMYGMGLWVADMRGRQKDMWRRNWNVYIPSTTDHHPKRS